MSSRPILAVLVLSIALGGCKIAEGDSCERGRGECVAGRTDEALACVDGHIAHVYCRGANACAPNGDRVSCDQSIGAPGDVCFGGSACSVDRASFLTCERGRFVVGARCPTGCRIEGTRAQCDAPELAPALR